MTEDEAIDQAHVIDRMCPSRPDLWPSRNGGSPTAPLWCLLVIEHVQGPVPDGSAPQMRVEKSAAEVGVNDDRRLNAQNYW